MTKNRRTIATSAVTIAALGAAAVVAALFTDPAPAPTADIELASTATCYDMISVTVAGRGDTPRGGVTKMLTLPDGTPLPAALSSDYPSANIDQVINPADGAVAPDSYAAVYVEYPADMATFESSVQTGVTNTQTVIKSIAASCPKTRFAIVGYSEGADVARRAAMEIGNQTVGADGKYEIIDPSQVVGVVILADAGRTAGSGPFPGSEDPFRNPDGFDTAYQNGNNATSGAGALPGTAGGFGALDGKVASFCAEGDLFCALPENTSLVHLAVNVGRQVNADALQRDNVTPATGGDLALTLGRIAMAAFNDIASQPNWMQSDETFLDVLLKVSDPGYTPAPAEARVAATGDTTPLVGENMVDLTYLPQKVFKEIVGFITSNQNTLPVVMNDPYGQTLAPGTGHHFDYWHDADPANGKQLTSAEYAAAWLTQLAKQAEAGEPVKTPAAAEKARLAVMADVAAQTTSAAPTTTTAPSATAAPTVVTGVPVPVAPLAPVVEPAVIPAVPAATALPDATLAPETAVPPLPEGAVAPVPADAGTAVVATTVVPTTSATP